MATLARFGVFTIVAAACACGGLVSATATEVDYARIDFMQTKERTTKEDTNHGVAQMSITGVFATYSPITNVAGYVFLADPMDGCGRMKRPKRIGRGSRFVFLARLTTNSTCTAMEQNYNAWNAGAAGIINMAPDGDSNYIWILQGTEADKTLPASFQSAGSIPQVAVSGQSGRKLETLVRQGNGHIKISAQGEMQEEEFLVIDLAITIVCIAVAVFVLLYAYRVGRSICLQTAEFEMESRPDPEQTARLRARVSEILIQDLPVTKFKTDPVIEEASDVDSCQKPDCAICLDELKEGVNVRTLSCNHVFHVDCIDPWLMEHHNCPLCKDDIIAPRAELLLHQDIELEQEEEQDGRVMQDPNFSLGGPPPPMRSRGSTMTSVQSESAPFIVTHSDTGRTATTDGMNSLSVGYSSVVASSTHEGCAESQASVLLPTARERVTPAPVIVCSGDHSPTAHMVSSAFNGDQRRITQRQPSRGDMDLTQVDLTPV